MAFDLDPFADIFPDGSVKNVRAGGKFQPKAKLRPRKELSTSIARVQPPQIVTVTHELAGVPPGNNKDELSGIYSSADDRSFHLVNPSSDLHSCFGRSEGENTDIFIGLDSFDDFIPQSTPVREAPDAHVCEITNAKGLGVRVPPPVDDGARDCSTVDACVPPEPATLDPLTSGEAALSIRDESFHVENSSFETEFREADTLSYLETLDVIPETNGSDAVEAVSYMEDDHAVPSRMENIDEGSVPSFENDDIIDFSSMQFSDSSPTDPLSHIPVFEETENSFETPHADATMPGKDNQRARRERRKSSTVSGLSSSCQEDEAGGSLGRRRKRINACQLIDESADEGLDDEGSPAECPGGSNMDEDNNDEDYQVENESEDRKVRRKSQKPVTDKEKRIRKRKKVDASSDQSSKAPKKFSHSTRRNRRQVDKALLDIPEDEVDFQRLPIRDLILLAEHNERIMNKEATTSGTQRQSTANTSSHYNEDDAFASEEGRDPNDVEASPVIQEVSTVFNYQTYMDKTPIARWSKQDTELFYERREVCAYPYVVSGYMRGGGPGALSVPNGGMGVDSMINVIAHELGELSSNLFVNAWYYAQGPIAPTEIGDLCEGLYSSDKRKWVYWAGNEG
ncbi:hypothetical protein RJ640_020580 [Escallonia rubra]|uniref:Uncharacterized protein n=1 Tax=Escallonia rubra TaxID=112253 RepID=A0AA88RK87_9ASTE|nr:hypothetical protein RJ640_020580 [Escallonia rubra]